MKNAAKVLGKFSFHLLTSLFFVPDNIRDSFCDAAVHFDTPAFCHRTGVTAYVFSSFYFVIFLPVPGPN